MSGNHRARRSPQHAVAAEIDIIDQAHEDPPSRFRPIPPEEFEIRRQHLVAEQVILHLGVCERVLLHKLRESSRSDGASSPERSEGERYETYQLMWDGVTFARDQISSGLAMSRQLLHWGEYGSAAEFNTAVRQTSGFSLWTWAALTASLSECVTISELIGALRKTGLRGALIGLAGGGDSEER